MMASKISKKNVASKRYYKKTQLHRSSVASAFLYYSCLSSASRSAHSFSSPWLTGLKTFARWPSSSGGIQNTKPLSTIFDTRYYDASSGTLSKCLGIKGGGKLSSSFSKPSSCLKKATTSLQCVSSDIGLTITSPASLKDKESLVTDSPTSRKTSADKLSALRRSMKELNLDVYLVPTDDPHLSEYVPDAYKRREFLSSFTGSAGTAVVTKNEALLWTDSRYWNEASLQLDLNQWKLVKSGLPDVPTIQKYLGDIAVKHYCQYRQPLRVGLDPFVHAASFPKDIEIAFKEACKEVHDDGGNDSSIEIGVIDTTNENLIDPIWGLDRPAIPTSPFRVHPIEYAGVTVDEKVTKIRKQMKEKGATLALFCTLDDVAYLFNMRAMGDVATCPVGIAYATVSNDGINLYCDPHKVTKVEVQEHLKSTKVSIRPYDSIVQDVENHCNENSKAKVWMDQSRANYKLSSIIPEGKMINEQNAITPMKACKNRAEMEGMRKAHLVDGAAMAKFVSWLEHTIVIEGRSISEVEIDKKLTSYRAEQPGFLEVSFPTIAGVGSNGAIIHYSAKEGDTELLKYLDTSNPILIDSGGQYRYGTTDVTRTWYFGDNSAISKEFIDYYTRVLKGNIGVDTLVFPENTPGFVLDVLARKSLWSAGKDYGHGTGHGVGAALNVHEGPMSISQKWGISEGLKCGMVISNEPGYYEDGNFGIRIENLLEIKYVKDEYNVERDEKGKQAGKDDTNNLSSVTEKKFLKFEKLTLIPIQTNLINTELLSEEEMDWLDKYHAEVLEKISLLLEPNSPEMKWLQKSCAKIAREK